MMDSALRAIDLVMRYKDVRVLNGLNLEVAEGSVFGLIGPNGAGKTTTIKTFMNILTPTRGRCEVFGIDSRELRDDYFAQIGYVSENQEMPGSMTVEYLLSYLKPFYPTWDDGRVKELLRQFKLPLDRKLRDLSRGMWMKASLTSSLAYRPKLLVLDEPFSGLDPLVREELIEGLIDCAEETSIFVSSHDLADIESFASHIGYLENGRLQFSEEMTSLSARFREVEVTVEPPAAVPAAREWPTTWLRPEASFALIRFVDSSFEENRSVFRIREIFGEVQRISVNPMPLRSIFLTLARGSRS